MTACTAVVLGGAHGVADHLPSRRRGSSAAWSILALWLTGASLNVYSQIGP